jgi:NADP-dependent 3-hydroxy acid dehydrogenase YdfG
MGGSLAGSSIAVTGAARGIGRATAELLVNAGAKVAIGDIDAEAAKAAAREIGGDTLALPLDVGDRSSFAAFLDGAAEAHGPLDVLVANAGLMPLGPFLGGDPGTYERTVTVNFTGCVNALHLALPPMVKRGRGRVVLVASLMGRITVPGAAVYGASKHAVVALAEAVRAEIRGSGVEVVSVLPSMVRTEALSGVSEGRMIPAVDPEEVAEAIVRACERGGEEIAVPGWAGPLARAGGAVPPVLMGPVRRLLRGDRALTGLDDAERAAYEERIKRD